MRVVLHVEIPVERFALFAEVAFMETRPELGLLCRAARDGGGRIDAATVQQALPGVAEAGARNVMRWCESIDLCDAQGSLTALGVQAAETGEVPVPEQGVYDIWVATHPLLGTRILHAERMVSRRDGRFPEARFDDIEPVPPERVALFGPARGRCFASLVDPKRRLVLRGLPGNHDQAGCLRQKTRSSLRLRWDLDMETAQDCWQLEGTIDAGKQPAPVQHTREHAGVDVRHLVATLAQRYLSAVGTWREHRLAVDMRALGKLGEDAQEQFLHGFELTGVALPGHGTFARVEVHDVPLVPATAGDAAQWARARLDRGLARTPRYRSRDDVRRLWDELVQGTPLAAFAPALPAHAQLIAARVDSPAQLWLLAAPMDLSLAEVREEEVSHDAT